MRYKQFMQPFFDWFLKKVGTGGGNFIDFRCGKIGAARDRVIFRGFAKPFLGSNQHLEIFYIRIYTKER